MLQNIKIMLWLIKKILILININILKQQILFKIKYTIFCYFVFNYVLEILENLTKYIITVV